MSISGPPPLFTPFTDAQRIRFLENQVAILIEASYENSTRSRTNHGEVLNALGHEEFKMKWYSHAQNVNGERVWDFGTDQVGQATIRAMVEDVLNLRGSVFGISGHGNADNAMGIVSAIGYRLREVDLLWDYIPTPPVSPGTGV